jgi:hypothetical protein
LDPTALTNYKPRLILWSLSHLLNFTRQRWFGSKYTRSNDTVISISITGDLVQLSRSHCYSVELKIAFSPGLRAELIKVRTSRSLRFRHVHLAGQCASCL